MKADTCYDGDAGICTIPRQARPPDAARMYWLCRRLSRGGCALAAIGNPTNLQIAVVLPD